MKKTTYILALAMAATGMISQVAHADWNSSGVKIMLDPGHGGSDPGAGGGFGRNEQDLALDCVKAMDEWLKGRSNPHKLTRTGNYDVSLSSRRSQSISYDPWVFCSVHLNAFNGSANGTETWYYWANRSPSLASKVQSQLVSKLGRVNRGVKQNGWTVITGASYIPAILTEALFVDNRTEYNMISSRSNAGFKGWVNGHLKGFYDFLNSEGAGCSTNPDTNPWGGGTTVTPTPTKPTIKASSSGLHFEKYVGESKSIEFTVTGSDLTENITVKSGSGRFTVDKTSLPKTGGTVKVTLGTLYDGVGTIGPNGTLAAGNFFKITLESKGATSVTVALTAEIKALPLQPAEKWNLSEQKGNKTSKGYDASNIRNFVYNDGKLYCVYNHKDILVLNAQTGEKLGFMKRGDVVKGGTLQLCDVKVLGGHVVACNLAVAKSGDKLRLYTWENDNANPTLLYETSDFQGLNRIGDCLEMTGTWGSDAWFAFAGQNDSKQETRIVEYNWKGGNSFTPKYTPVYTVYGSTRSNLSTLSTVRAYPKTSGWWVDGKDSYPTWATFDANQGGAVRKTYVDTGESWGSSHHEFNYGNQKYSANLVFNNKEYMTGTETLDSEKNYKGGRMRIIADLTGDFTRINTIGDYPSEGLGSTSRNTNATGDIMVNTDGSTYFEGWVLSTLHGVAYYTHGSVPAKNPGKLELQEPETDQPAGPSISADKTTLSFNTVEGNTQSQEIKVTGANLTGNIDARITGNDAHLFTVTPASFKGSSTISVTYAPTAQGSHSATLTLSSDGATNVNVALTGKATQLVTLNDNITADKVEKAWVYSTNEGVGPWYVADANSPYVRDIAADNQTSDGQAVYAMKVKGWGAVAVEKIDVFTGKKLSDLKVDGITGGTFKLGSVCVIDGKLYASNACTAAQPHIVYRWDNDASTPVKVLEVAGNGHVGGLGSRMSFVGTGSTGRLYFTSNGSSLIYYEMNNGVINATPKQLKLTDADGKEYVYSDAGNDTYGAAEVHSNGDGTLWVTSMKAAPKRFDANGKMVETMGLSLASVYGSGMKTFNIGEKRYALVADFEKTNINGKMSIVNVTNGFSGKDAIATLPANGLGTAGNAQRSTTVQYLHNDNNHVVFMLVNVPNQGVACYKYNGRVAGQTGVDEITIDSIDPNAPVEYYNLQGVKVNVDNLIPGLYIRRQENKTDKVLIK
ncbi:MAG: DUF4623 domain-containing protein [Muribaculaceae bacterium]|nr:DUF4623 domain-containing protein [Muribaculaceae bacterium]